MEMRFERPELKDIVEDTRESFKGVKGDKRRWVYIYSPEKKFKGGLETEPPGHWSEELSCAYAGGGKGLEDRIRMMPKEEQKEFAYNQWKAGKSYKEIGEMLGIAKTTAYYWVKEQMQKRGDVDGGEP